MRYCESNVPASALRELRVNPATGLVREVHFVDRISRREMSIKARVVVLAAGSILVGVFPGPLLDLLHPATQSLLTTVTAQIPRVVTLAQILFK